MRTNSTTSSLLVLAIGGLLYSIVSSHSQGPLTPPGAPAPTMKTLDQIEARRPVQSLAATAPYTISQPGSYYLTGNITVASGDAIVITSDDVSLDLNGFTIRSTYTVAVSPENPTGGSSGNAINISGDRSRLTVRNGSIVSGTAVPESGPAVAAGFGNGIYSGSTITQAIVSEVHVTGVAGTGIYLDKQGVVERCTLRRCGWEGIFASEVQNCSVENCLRYGIRAAGNAINCTAFGRDGIGLSCANATNCTGTSTGGTGLSCGGNATNCFGTSTDGTGLSCDANATNCTGTSTDGTGLSCGFNASNCFGRSVSGSAGMEVSGTASFCRGSRAGGVAIAASNAIGCTVSNGTVSAPLKSLGTP